MFVGTQDEGHSETEGSESLIESKDARSSQEIPKLFDKAQEPILGLPENPDKLEPSDNPGNVEAVLERARSMSMSNPDYVWTLYCKRWAVLIALAVLNFLQCVATICLSAFISQEAVAFGQAPWIINLCNSSSALLFLPSFIFATKLYTITTLRKALLICSLLIFFGAWIRVVAIWDGNFWWVVAGQTIFGISSPITICGVSILANYWFGDHERGRATALMLVSNPLGFLVSFSIQMYYSVQIEKEANVYPLNTPEW